MGDYKPDGKIVEALRRYNIKNTLQYNGIINNLKRQTIGIF